MAYKKIIPRYSVIALYENKGAVDYEESVGVFEDFTTAVGEAYLRIAKDIQELHEYPEPISLSEVIEDSYSDKERRVYNIYFEYVISDDEKFTGHISIFDNSKTLRKKDSKK